MVSRCEHRYGGVAFATTVRDNRAPSPDATPALLTRPRTGDRQVPVHAVHSIERRAAAVVSDAVLPACLAAHRSERLYLYAETHAV
jgi:hypothetical protein